MTYKILKQAKDFILKEKLKKVRYLIDELKKSGGAEDVVLQASFFEKSLDEYVKDIESLQKSDSTSTQMPHRQYLRGMAPWLDNLLRSGKRG